MHFKVNCREIKKKLYLAQCLDISIQQVFEHLCCASTVLGAGDTSLKDTVSVLKVFRIWHEQRQVNRYQLSHG